MGRKVGAMFSAVTIFVELFTALFLTPLIIRSFGQAEYGVYTLVISLTAYLTLLDLGVGNSVVKFMAQYRVNNQQEEQRKFLGVTTVYYAIIAALVMVAGAVIVVATPVFFSKGLNPSEILLAQKLMWLTCINIAITLGTAGFFYTVVSFENFYISKGVTILTTLVRIVVSVIALENGVKSFGIVIINLIATAVIRFIVVFYVLFVMKIKPTLKKVNFSLIKGIISYSAIILLQMIATQINNMTGQLFIGSLATASSGILAVYGVGSQISHYFQSFGGVLNGVLMPGVVRLVETDGTVKSVQREMVRVGRLNLAFVGFIWAAFLVFGKQFVVLWSGNINREAYIVALLLMFPMIFVLSQNIGSQVLWATNKHKRQAILKLVVVFVNVLLTFILVKWNAILGATIGTFVSLMLGDVLVMQVVFKKDIGINLFEYYKDLFRGVGPALMISLAFAYLFRFIGLEGWLGLIINCAAMCCCFLVCMMWFGFDKYEKSLIKKIKNIGR